MRQPFRFLTRIFLFGSAAALILILLVLFVFPRAGMGRTTTWWSALTILALWLVFIIVLLILRRTRSSHSTRVAVSSISSRTAPDSFGAAGVGERLNRTIQWLKQSKLAQTSKDPVYNLPWYLFIGLPGSGKSTLIVQSGFSFSYTEPKKPLGRPIVGPTEGCDFWVANEAVFIDPSGRYFADDISQDGWAGILDQIKQRRKARPADGVVLVIDIDSLIGAGPDAIRVQAERTRSVLDLTAKAFGMVLPVYLLFDKIDLLDGFEEFFAGAGNGDSTPFGTTFRQEQYESPHPEEEFKSSFDGIYKSLLVRRVSLLSESNGAHQEKAYAFPAQFPLIRERLSEFIEVLFQMNQFREQPLFRGFYFTSSLQTGRKRNPIADLMASTAGLPKAMEDPPLQQTKNYFIHSLFTRVIIPDRGLAGLSREARRRRLYLRMMAWGSAGIVLPLTLLLFAWGAYRDSSQLIATATAAHQISVGDGKTSENLAALLDLQRRLMPFECRAYSVNCEERNQRFYWGMYPEDAAVNASRGVYLEKVKALFLDPLLNADTRLGQKYNGVKTQLDLISIPTAAGTATQTSAQFDAGKTYNLLKTFLMFSSQTKANSSFLFDQTQDDWCRGVSEKDRPAALEILRFYLLQLGDQNAAYLLTRSQADNETIDRVRKMLLVVDPDQYYYDIIRSEGKRKVDSISMNGILGPRGSVVFESDASVDGPYTKVGWDTYVKDKIAAMTADYEDERSWVLGTSAAPPGGMTIDEKLRSYYFRDYQQQWWNFLKGIRVKHISTFQDSSRELAVLTDPQALPMTLLFNTVSRNTWDDLDKLNPGDQKQVATLDGAGGMRFGVAQSFQSVHALTTRNGDQDSPLAQYVKSLSTLLVAIRTFLDSNQPAGQIQNIGQDADAAMQVTNGLLVNLDANARQAVEPLLEQPIQETMAILGKSTPVGTVQDIRQRGLSIGGILKEKGKSLQGATVLLMQAYSDSKFLAEKEMMRTQTQAGKFQFPNPVNPGPFKVCASRKGETNYFCGDVLLDRGSNGKAFQLRRPRSMVVFGGGELDLIVQIK